MDEEATQKQRPDKHQATSTNKKKLVSLATAALDIQDLDDPLWDEPKSVKERESCIAPLVIKLTGYHGTKVPVIIVFFLTNGEVDRLCFCDKFWRRICTRSSIKRALFCRDFHRDGMSNSRPCVWQTLHGRTAGLERCLLHRYESLPADFVRECNGITRIPGRSSEELSENYKKWREARRAVGIEAAQEEEVEVEVTEVRRPSWMSRTEGMPRRMVSALTKSFNGMDMSSEGPPLPWSTAVHCTFALSAKHRKLPAKSAWAPVRSKGPAWQAKGASSQPESAASTGMSWPASLQTTASTGVSWQTKPSTAASLDNRARSRASSAASRRKPWAKGDKAGGSQSRGFRGAANMALTAR